MQWLEAVTKRNELAVKRYIKAVESRDMKGYYAATPEEARELILNMIPKGSRVGWGGGQSINQLQLKEAIHSGYYVAVDRERAKTAAERKELERQCFFADYFLMGTNAITEDGQLINLDGNANRVAALCYGPDHVIVIAGMNKIVRTVDEGIARVRNFVAPTNAMRFPGNTPCRKLGICGNCHSGDCICCQLVITRKSFVPGRIQVVFVNAYLGY